MTYTFTFELGTEVCISALKQVASIEGVRIMGYCNNEQYLREEYFVIYWLDGKREQAWLFAHELKTI